MTRDDRAEWLAGIAVELARRVREDLPCDYRDWLHAVTTPEDREALLYVQAAANPPTEAGFARATGWARRTVTIVDEIAVELARKGEPVALRMPERLAVAADLLAANARRRPGDPDRLSSAEIGRRAGLSRRQMERVKAGQVKHMEQLPLLRAVG